MNSWSQQFSSSGRGATPPSSVPKSSFSTGLKHTQLLPWLHQTGVALDASLASAGARSAIGPSPLATTARSVASPARAISSSSFPTPCGIGTGARSPVPWQGEGPVQPNQSLLRTTPGRTRRVALPPIRRTPTQKLHGFIISRSR